MRILVTGALGLLGTELSIQLQKDGHEVLGLDNFSRYSLLGEDGIRAQESNLGLIEKAGAKFVKWDLSHDCYSLAEIDAVVHAAAQTCHSRKGLADDPRDDAENNIQATLYLLEEARIVGEQQKRNIPFLFISSAKVYGENSNFRTPLHEDCPLGDQTHITFFGASKVAADLFAQMYARKYSMPVGVFRPGCFTGPNALAAEAQNWAPWLVHCAFEGQEFNVFGDGWQIRDLLHVSDVANACACWLKNPKAGVWNIGGGTLNTISLADAIFLVSQLTGNMVTSRRQPQRPGDLRRLVVSGWKFADEYGWPVTQGVKEIFTELVESQRKNR